MSANEHLSHFQETKKEHPSEISFKKVLNKTTNVSLSSIWQIRYWLLLYSINGQMLSVCCQHFIQCPSNRVNTGLIYQYFSSSGLRPWTLPSPSVEVLYLPKTKKMLFPYSSIEIRTPKFRVVSGVVRSLLTAFSWMNQAYFCLPHSEVNNAKDTCAILLFFPGDSSWSPASFL